MSRSGDDEAPPGTGGRQRVDRWLFFARVTKSRTLAARLASAGHVRINREKISQPSEMVRPGDVLTIALDRRVLVYRVLAPGTRRGPAAEARLLYEDLSPPPAPRQPEVGMRPAGSGRPTKKERRDRDRLAGD